MNPHATTTRVRGHLTQFNRLERGIEAMLDSGRDGTYVRQVVEEIIDAWYENQGHGEFCTCGYNIIESDPVVGWRCSACKYPAKEMLHAEHG